LWLASSQLEAPAVEAELADIKSRMATAASHAQLDKSRGDDRNMTLDKLIQCHEQLADFSEARTQNSSASNEIYCCAPKDCWPSLINWAQSRDEDSLYHRLLDQVNGFYKQKTKAQPAAARRRLGPGLPPRGRLGQGAHS
jgi:hypothetical protein